MTVQTIRAVRRAAKRAKEKSDIFHNRMIELIATETGVTVRGKNAAATGGALGVPVNTVVETMAWEVVNASPDGLLLAVERVAEKIGA